MSKGKQTKLLGVEKYLNFLRKIFSSFFAVATKMTGVACSVEEFSKVVI